MPRVRVSDISMHYDVEGEGPPLLVTSGWAMVERIAGLYRTNLTRHFRCIFHEHRMIGRSDGPDRSTSIAEMADDLVGLLDRLGIERCPVEGGGGMGALVAMELAIRHPDRITALHLGSPCLTLDHFSRELMQVWKALRRHDVDLWARAVTLSVYTPDTYATRFEMVSNAARIRASEPTFPFEWSYDRVVDAYCAYDARGRARAIRCPTLITTGGNIDLLSGPRFASAVAAEIAGSQLHVFDQSSHNYWVEQKEQWEAGLLAFFLPYRASAPDARQPLLGEETT